MEQDIGIPTRSIRRNVNGIALHCVEAGPEDGPLVILLHGFPEFWWGWRHQIGPLARAGFRVLVPDQRGYNLSDKPEGRAAYVLDELAKDVIGLAGACGREVFHLVGHDWGGLVAWWTATRYPQRVAKLVAINAPHPAIAGRYLRSHPVQMMRSLYIGFFQLPRLPELMLSADGYRGLKNALVRSSRPDTFSGADLARYEEAWSQPGALTAMLNWYRALPLSATSGTRPRVTMPVLLVWGIRDQFLQKGLAERSLALCDNARACWFDHATHWVHLEEPEATGASLLEFLSPQNSGNPCRS